MIDLVETVSNIMRGISDKCVAVGVSGGRDSMCLLHALISGGFGKRVLAVHINHGLRETAKRDEDFVRAFCAERGIAFRSVRVDVKKKAAADGLTVEQAARVLRYDALFDFVKSGAANYVMTAHHALDNCESVLMHMFRGAGLDGLCGMKEFDAERKIVRPLLGVYPETLDFYARENKLEYVTDETNFMTDADRNFIRLNVIPLIETCYRGVVRAVNGLSRECDGVVAALDTLADGTKIRYDRGAVCLELSALDGVFAGRLLRRALGYFSGVDVTREQIDGAAALRHKRVGAVAELANGVKAEREHDCVALYIPRDKFCGEAELKLGANVIDGLRLNITRTDVEPAVAAGRVADFDKLRGAVVRFRRDGDLFTPFGGKSKKLKQYFTDNKIPNRIKDRTPLICRGNEVLAIAGVQISDKVRVTESTTDKVLITL